jgi:hypothetical protein
MEYVLTGFKQNLNIRLFAFDGLSDDRSNRTRFTVGVDISLIRKYDISLQELPLLCRHLLEEQTTTGTGRTLTFTEAHMVGHADRRAADQQALEQRRVHRKAPSNRVGEAWRHSSPFSRNPD